jgi:hypothetical protein
LLPNFDKHSLNWIEIKIDEEAGEFFLQKKNHGAYKKMSNSRGLRQHICYLIIPEFLQDER